MAELLGLTIKQATRNRLPMRVAAGLMPLCPEPVAERKHIAIQGRCAAAETRVAVPGGAGVGGTLHVAEVGLIDLIDVPRGSQCQRFDALDRFIQSDLLEIRQEVHDRATPPTVAAVGVI